MAEAEHITRLMSVKDLLKELDVLRLKAVEREEAATKDEELEKVEAESPKPETNKTNYRLTKPHGGAKMAKFGMVLFAAAAFAAGYFAYSENKENEMLRQRISGLEAQMQDLRDTTYTPAEMEQVLALRRELGDQIKGANNYLLTIAKGENNFKQLVAESKDYLNKLPKKEVLEESVAQEVAGMHGFLDSYTQDQVLGLIQDCYCATESGLDGKFEKKSDLKGMVNGLNTTYVNAFSELKQASQEVVQHLGNFKQYAASYPLKQRKAMLAKIDKEIEKRQTIMENADAYLAVFAANMDSDSILPVKAREN
jgi:hypothetical protein